MSKMRDKIRNPEQENKEQQPTTTCKCKNEMMEIADYKVDLFIPKKYSTVKVFWCNVCGRAVSVEKYDCQKDIFTWHEHDSIPCHLKHMEPYKESKVAKK